MDGLTPKEREVLSLMADGFTTKEIAQQLSVSFHTVESHRKNLLTKFKVKNSVHLVSKAWSSNLLQHAVELTVV
jgi:DNA-binding CsgD family transcriptional regulator